MSRIGSKISAIKLILHSWQTWSDISNQNNVTKTYVHVCAFSVRATPSAIYVASYCYTTIRKHVHFLSQWEGNRSSFRFFVNRSFPQFNSAKYNRVSGVVGVDFSSFQKAILEAFSFLSVVLDCWAISKGIS